MALRLLGGRVSFLPLNEITSRNRFYGKGTMLTMDAEAVQRAVLSTDIEHAIQERRVFTFPKCVVDSGVVVRDHSADGNFLDRNELPRYSRNFSVVCNHLGSCFIVRLIVAIMSRNIKTVENSVVFVERLPLESGVDDCIKVGTRSVKCRHFGLFSKPKNEQYELLNLSEISNQLFLLRRVDNVYLYSISPSVWRLT